MRATVPLVLLATLGCTPPDARPLTDGPAPVYDPSSGDLFDAPWPSDALLRDDGTTRVEGFPGDDAPLLSRYLALANAQTGYGTNSPVYVRFDAPIDTSRLPTPAESTELDSGLVLVDVDPTSPRWGERIPVRWEYQEERTRFQPENLLAVAPVWGFPLRPRTTYALVVTTRVAAPNEAFAEVWDPEHPDHDLYAGLQDALVFHRLGTDDVAVATVFTTMDPVEELDRVARYVHEALSPPPLTQTLDHLADEDTAHYRVYEGRYQGPLFQHGERPYAFEGGAFRFDDRGRPIVAEWEPMRMSVCTPLDLSDPPEGGWPVVLYAHGTFGDYRSFCQGTGELETASLLAEAGIVGIGIDQPLHGTRATDTTNPELHWFNYLNPDSGRTNFRQAAIDTVYLAHALTAQPVVLTTSDGHELPLDPARISFMGHSQGGISGAIALPFLGRDVSSAVLSGAGAGLGITVVERKDPLDIAEQLANVLEFDDGEVATELHPVIGLIQWLVEVTDPANYAPYYFAEGAGLSGQAPLSVLITSGQHDAQTPHRTTSTLAASAQAPLLAPRFDVPPGLALRDLAGVRGPVTDNVTGFDGTPRTAGLSQWEDGDHWVVFYDEDAARMVQHFLATAADGAPEIVRDR